MAVTLKGGRAYLGWLVNPAARVKGQSQGQEVVISQAMMTDPAVMDYLKHHDVNVKSFDANLKGFADSFTLHRLTVDTVSGQDTRPVARNVAAGYQRCWAREITTLMANKRDFPKTPR